MKVNHAYITGFKPNGYRLNIVDSPATSEFMGLHRQFFTQFRAAQILATAINAYVHKQPKWARTPYRVML